MNLTMLADRNTMENMKYKIFSPKYGTQVVLMDDEDIPKIGNRGFSLSKAGQFLYVRVKPHKLFLHRIVMDAPRGKIIDHINRNTLDNRKNNLRIVTIQQNLRNQKRPNNKTGYTGVSLAYKGKYEASLKLNYKKIYLGIFPTIKRALKARKEAELKYWK